MNQVLLNLFLNALEAISSDGPLTVSADRDDNRRYPHTRRPTPAPGIAAENLAHVFDPYFTTKSTGTGLGLAIAHNIVDAHGGRIDVASLAGQGTTFTVRVPLTGQKDVR